MALGFMDPQEESANKGIYLGAVTLTFDVALGASTNIILE